MEGALTLAEELLLLALHDEKGSTGFTQIDPGLAGALLVDLGRLGALRPEVKELAAVAGSGPEHPVLARAHAVISTSPKLRSAKSWVGRLPGELKPLTGAVAAPTTCGSLTADSQRPAAVGSPGPAVHHRPGPSLRGLGAVGVEDAN